MKINLLILFFKSCFLPDNKTAHSEIVAGVCLTYVAIAQLPEPADKLAGTVCAVLWEGRSEVLDVPLHTMWEESACCSRGLGTATIVWHLCSLQLIPSVAAVQP